MKPTIYVVTTVDKAGHLSRPLAAYESIHWAKAHFETSAKWRWDGSGKKWTATTEWPRPVIFELELKDHEG